jgi:hypothetical protein
VLAQKLREAMALEGHAGEVLTGTVEIDGACFGGQVRLENAKADRRDRRLKANQSGMRRVVVVMRERQGRTRPVVTLAEAEGVAIVHADVDRMAILSADAASHWEMLHAG